MTLCLSLVPFNSPDLVVHALAWEISEWSATSQPAARVSQVLRAAPDIIVAAMQFPTIGLLSPPVPALQLNNKRRVKM